MINRKFFDKVLAYCVDHADNGFVYGKINFAEVAYGSNTSDVFAALSLLREEKRIDFLAFEDGDSITIEGISVLPAANKYFLDREKERADRFTNWKWNIGATVITSIISALLGALLARVSLILWP